MNIHQASSDFPAFPTIRPFHPEKKPRTMKAFWIQNDTATRWGRVALGLLLCSVLALPVLAQDEDDDFSLLRFNGGTVQADIQLGINFAGVGVGSGTVGGVISPRMTSGAASLFTNPAELGLLRHRHATFGTKFALGTRSLGLDGNSFLSEDQIASDTDELLEEFNFPANGSAIYTDASDIRAGQVGRLSSFALAMPLHERVVLGFGLHYPLDVGMDFRVSGIETLIDAAQESGDQTIAINILTNVNTALAIDLDMTALSFGVGGTVYEGDLGRVTTGFSLNRYTVTNSLTAALNLEGMVVLSGSQEYFFNDPNDPNLNPDETNAFFWEARGNFTDDAWGVRAGLVYELPMRGWSLSLAYNGYPTFELNDPNAFSRGFLPAFIDTDAIGEEDENGEELDPILIEEISLAKPNLTAPTSDSLGQTLTFQYPSSITAGLDVGLGPHTFALNYIAYLNGFTYEGVYGQLSEDLTDNTFKVGKDLSSGIRVGFDLKFPDQLRGGAFALIPVRLLFLDIDGLLLQAFGKYTRYSNPRYRLGGTLGFGPSTVEGRLASQCDDDVDVSLCDILDSPLPGSFSLGRQYTIFDNLDVGVMVFSFPDMLFRVSMGYTFR